MRASRSLVTLAVAGGLMLGGRHIERANGQECQQLTFTLASDFADEFWINLNTNGGDELRVNAAPRPLPYIWVALSGRGTIVRIDTVTGDILGEYRSAPDGRGTDPSRTTVDPFGNVWAGNRAETDNGRGSVVKIGQVPGRNRPGKIGGTPGNGDWTRDGASALPAAFELEAFLDREPDAW